MSYRGRGRGGFHHNNNNRNNAQNNNSVEVEIFGWNGSTPGECIAFISRKTKINVTNYSVDNLSGAMRGFVVRDKADELIAWSGVRFAGNPLKITKVEPAAFGGQANTSGENTIETLSMFLKLRYNPQNKFLNLSAVHEDPTLKAKGYFGSLSTSSKFFPALMKIASDLKLEVESADLSRNNLTDLTSLSTLAPTFPHLQNLSLQDNKLVRVSVFQTWKKKLNHLRELIIIGNPIVNTNNPTEIVSIKTELLKAFPRLVVLNGEIVRNEQALLDNLKFAFPLPQATFFQDSEVQGLSTNFISNYLNIWDSNRADLMMLYQTESQFSLQVDSTLPLNLDGKPPPDFGYYLTLSRNLTRVSSAKARMSKVAIGPEHIFKEFSQLPKTRHDLLAKPENFSMESYRLPQMGAICINIHGSFEETAPPQNQSQVSSSGNNRNKYAMSKKQITLGRKSFDRTFIVIPGANSSMIVASDLLCIRPEADPEVFSAKPKAAPAVAPVPGVPQMNAHVPTPPPQQQFATPPPAGPSTADLPAELKTSLNQIQQELLVKVLVETKLNIQYGFMLCQQSNWDYQQCTLNFKNSASSLPPDAFAN